MALVHPGKPPTPPTAGLAIARLQAFVLRWPVREPVRTSFGTMLDRPAVLVRVEDSDGAHGWGEAWCNFPSCGAEHRARLIETVLAPLVVGRAFRSPAEAFDEMSARTAVLALQSGEPGPLAQAIAGIDIALHDLAARRAGQPLWRVLRDTATASARPDGSTGGSARSATVPVYASGINPDDPAATVAALRRSGYTAFKLKVGFGAERDVDNLAAVRAAVGDGTTLMVDANQAWDLPTAIGMAARLGELRPAWLEEPLRADRPWHEWRALAQASPLPLAAGENAIGAAGFEALIASGTIAVVQPDLAKWGGISGVLARHRPHRRCRPALLPALSRRRHRPARLGACARRPRRPRRPPGSRRQREPSAHPAVPAAGEPRSGLHHAGRHARAWQRARSPGTARALRPGLKQRGRPRARSREPVDSWRGAACPARFEGPS